MLFKASVISNAVCVWSFDEFREPTNASFGTNYIKQTSWNETHASESEMCLTLQKKLSF